MSRIGDIADMAEYLTERITARDPADPKTMREQLRDFAASPAALAQRYYRPTTWSDLDDTAMRDAIVPNKGMNLFAASEQEAPQAARAQAEGARTVANWMIPHSVSDVALMAALGPVGGKVAKAGLGAFGLLGSEIPGLGIEEAQAGKLRGTGPLDRFYRGPESSWLGNVKDLVEAGHMPGGTYANWYMRHGPKGEVMLTNESGPTGNKFAMLKGTMRPEEMVERVTGAPPVLRGKTFDMADLQRQNAELVFGPTDATAGGTWLNLPGGSIRQEAGINFPQIHKDVRIPGMPEDVRPLYASVDSAAANKVNRVAEDVLQRGGTPVYAPIVMGPGAGDSAKQMAATVLTKLQHAKPGADAVKVIDDAVRSKLGGDDLGYPGYDSAMLSDWLDRSGLAGRRAFTEGVDTRKVLDATGVDVGLARFLNTDPRFHHTPSGSAGAVLGRMRPDVGITDYQLHSNYGATFMGQKGEIGGLPGSAPFSWIAPDMYRALLKYKSPGGGSFADTPAVISMRGIPKDVPQTQKVTDEVVDNMGRWFEKHPSGWAIPGAIGLGAIADQSRYQR